MKSKGLVSAALTLTLLAGSSIYTSASSSNLNVSKPAQHEVKINNEDSVAQPYWKVKAAYSVAKAGWKAGTSSADKVGTFLFGFSAERDKADVSAKKKEVLFDK
ncbi:hypothetical protein [Peribacillus frigoritolerans]|uniref:hypothetical protein n=1 Tax=Peribacillus frigoritolerans TaxID=450367 RepID=UPI002E20795A|nr:hypothetical protein [Peribacillus frigoritolerans]MED3845745.1 hypothetical protein [Peribacillus frigoritolerans]WVN10382.1 hypothetical protein V2I71_22955 [Peribacillus frigoritolerans]